VLVRVRPEVQEVSRGLTRSRSGDIVRLLVAALAALTLTGVATTFRIWQQGEQDERGPADAIVVLGAAQYDGRPSPVLAARLDHAIDLWRQGSARAFVVTGGKVPGDRTTEAAVSREYAIAHGVPAEAIFGEDQARNTLASMRTVAQMMRDRGLHSAVFVSDPTHMLRVLRLARDLGLQGFGSPTRTSPVQADVVERAWATVHEIGALAVYFVTGGEPESANAGG
jgi:uncharacterized SAM-binding protein YcdF (DUF218 family)